MFKEFAICIFISMFYNNITSLVPSYGEFNVVVKEFINCNGPKQKNCSNIIARMYNTSNLLYDVQILQNVVPDKGKILVIVNDKPMVRLQMKKPCDHLFVGPILKEYFNSDNCVFKKGNYTLNINIEEWTQKYYGGIFLYGNVTFKTILHNNECNFICSIANVEIKPKT